MRVEVVTRAAAEPLDLDATKVELRIDGEERDDQIARFIGSARSLFEEETGYALINRTLRAYLRWWPKSTNVLLPYPPLVSVTSVTHYPLGVPTVMLEDDDFLVDRDSRQGSILLVPGSTWPTGVLYPPNIAIEYIAGFGEAATDVPMDILECLMAIISFWDEVPEAVYVPGTNKTAGKVELLPFSARDIIARYKKERDK